MTGDMRTLAIIPAFNEGDSLVKTVRKSRRYVDSVLLLYDEPSEEICNKLDGICDIITSEKRSGKGSAIRRGMEYAFDNGYDAFVIIDSDGERDVGDIKGMLNLLGSGYDIVIGKRDRQRCISRLLLNRFTNWWINIVTGYSLSDSLSGFNAFRTSSARRLDLSSNGFEIETEMVLEAKRNLLKVAEFPIIVPSISKSKVRLKDHIMINNLFDRWVIMNRKQLDVGYPRKIFILAFATFGLMIGRMLE
ncbi:MAG: hypothetical protein DRO99_03020 [Candidatus Aenigmatarchaeota archaeon]|nr:MAG: hypothetical protein DRO99_03020 [Candidatus Aenigmarchaeota archaeon]